MGFHRRFKWWLLLSSILWSMSESQQFGANPDPRLNLVQSRGDPEFGSSDKSKMSFDQSKRGARQATNPTPAPIPIPPNIMFPAPMMSPPAMVPMTASPATSLTVGITALTSVLTALSQLAAGLTTSVTQLSMAIATITSTLAA